MRIKRWTAVLMLLLLMIPALPTAGESSPVGRWSGSVRGEGRKASASATFSEGGGCTLSAGGYSASGTWSGGSIKVSAYGRSATLSYSVNGDKMTISGGLNGMSATMSLSRKSGGDDAKAASARVYGNWTCDDERSGVRYEVGLFAGGWLLWSETDEEASVAQYGTKLKVSDGKLTLTALNEAPQAPACWTDSFDAESNAWTIRYEIVDEKLTLFSGDEALAFERAGDVDAKPSDALFVPFVTLKRGDRGEAVRLLQEALIAGAYLPEGEADGIFGGKTETAVKAFQKANDLKQDGIAGPQVRGLLAD